MMTDPFFEHRAALLKIDEAVAKAAAVAGDALACRRGCASCCVDGLTVLPVEAGFIEASGLGPPARPAAVPGGGAPGGGACAFLDDEGACSIYAARPVLCRTHGLALRSGEGRADEEGRGLRVLDDDVSACALNYAGRPPRPAEVLDATKLLMLLVTVDRRYRARVGLADDDGRVPLRQLAGRLMVRSGTR